MNFADQVYRERRAHWDDDLIAAVGNAVGAIPDYDWSAGSPRDAYRLLQDLVRHLYGIIAVVEDWQASADRQSTIQRATMERNKAIAERDAIRQRVGELCQSAIDESHLSDASIARAAMAQRILLALDGTA